MCGLAGGACPHEDDKHNKKGKKKMNQKKKQNRIVTGMKLFACMMLCFLLVQKPQEIQAADTDRTGWIPISNVDDLQKLFSSTGSDKYYLTNDIDLSRYGYWPGEHENNFGGTFDGNGHSISNLTSTSSGLFKELLPGAVVENVRLLNVKIQASDTVGGIANSIGSWKDGRKDKVKISNCIVTEENDYYLEAGILGANKGMPVEIDSCINDARSSAGILYASSGEDVMISNCCDLYTDGCIVYSMKGGTISNCYADRICKYGGIDREAKIFSSYYYDKNASDYISSLFKPTYLDSAASVKKSSYEGWNFDTVWMINRGINNGRPIPRWILPYAKISAPHANMSAGTYDHEFRVELGSDVENVQIYYTTDGSKPTKNSTLYTGSIAVKGNMKLKLFSVLEGTIPSSTATYKYKVRCAAPKANYPDQKAFQKSATIKLTTAEPGASIYYTTDGTKPTAKSKLYQGGIKLTKNTTLKAVTVKDGKANSKTLVMHYIVKRG